MSRKDPSKNVYEEEDAWLYERMMTLNDRKQQALSKEDYDDANLCKKMMEKLKQFGYVIKEKEDEKKQAIEDENYERAKDLKQEIDQQKKEIEEILENPDVIDEINEDNNEFQQDNEFASENMNEFLQKHTASKSKSKFYDNESKLSALSRSRKRKVDNNYDDRVIPTISNKQKTEPNEEQEKEPIKLELE